VLELSNRVYLVSHGSITATVDPINETEQDLLYKLFGLKTGANLEK
jgi:hypothetical protein